MNFFDFEGRLDMWVELLGDKVIIKWLEGEEKMVGGIVFLDLVKLKF